MPAFSAGVSSAMFFLPEAAGTTISPAGPSRMVSSSEQRPSSTCERFQAGVRPSSTSTLARPMSPSSSSVLRPVWAMAVERFTETVVLPTPPLPLATAITFGGGRGPVPE